MNFEQLYVNPAGRTSRNAYIGALVMLLAAAALYYFIVVGRTGQFALLMLAYPALVLHARRLHDMGQGAWPLIAPAALFVLTAWFHLADPHAGVMKPITWAAIVVSAAFVLWGLIGKERAETPAP